MDDVLGRVVAVSGSQMRAAVTAGRFADDWLRVGAMVTVPSAGVDVVGTIATAEFENHGSRECIVLVVELLGEIVPSAEDTARFCRGVSRYPIPGAAVRAATAAELATVYTQPSLSSVSIGTLYHDARRPAFVLIDELLAKNFAVLGAAGSGKSCAITLVLSAILADHPGAHITSSWTPITSMRRHSKGGPSCSASIICNCRCGCSILTRRSARWCAAEPFRSRKLRRSS